MIERCKDCLELIWNERHKCPDRWLVWCEEDGEEECDAGVIYAADASGAVERWAADGDAWSAEYAIVGGHMATVKVRKHGSQAPWDEWTVMGEIVPEYTARQVDGGGDD